MERGVRLPPGVAVAGVRWFLASEAALFGGLLVSTLYLRAGFAGWAKDASHLAWTAPASGTICLLVAASLLHWVRTSREISPHALLGAASAGLLFLAIKGADYVQHWDGGFRPDVSPFWAAFYLLSSLHALHVAGGVVAAFGLAWLHRRWHLPPDSPWVQGLALYWDFVDLVWFLLLAVFYVF
ncbi:MAG: hypothetical protein KatS3mg077_0061 [Candidatus Binatia bacterium]|nr:MAG: hypothetical protein KatS3mg077_0061 [Candidatus Binatia bacterium]